jgi:hypothetical protein
MLALAAQYDDILGMHILDCYALVREHHLDHVLVEQLESERGIRAARKRAREWRRSGRN